MARFQAVGVLSLTQIAGSVSQVLMPDKRRDSASRGQMLAGGLMLMRAEGSTTFNEPIDPDWFDSEDAARDYLIGIAFARTLSKVTIKVV
jgi:hypothetical protein